MQLGSMHSCWTADGKTTQNDHKRLYLLYAQLSSLAKAGDGGGAVVGLPQQRHDRLHRALDADQAAVHQRRKCLRLSNRKGVSVVFSVKDLVRANMPPGLGFVAAEGVAGTGRCMHAGRQ